MPLIDRAQLPQGVQLIFRGETRFRHHGIEHRAGMALGKDESVTIRPLWVLRVDSHEIEVKLDEDLDRRKRAAWVAGARRADHFDNVAPDLFGDALELHD